LSADKLGNTPTVSFLPDRQTTELFSGFAQDELTIVPERLHLTAGAKLEHNDYTRWEIQPSGRITWTPGQRQTLWGAVSRAVRTPSRAEEDVILNTALPPGALFPGSPAGVSTIYGNQNFESEKLTAYELGYRVEPLRTLALDMALFYNVYDDLRSQELGFSPTQAPAAPPPPPSLVIPLNLQNGLEGSTYGGELAATWQLTDWWRLQPSYSLLKMHMRTKGTSTDVSSVRSAEGSSPQQQFSLRSSMDLPHQLSFDWTLRFVDELPALAIHSYFALDVRVGWKPTRSLELAIVGQNLLNSRHAEFVPTFIGTQVTEVPAGVYGQITWCFDKKH
jgi:iron complex outermembrane recepter protein